MLQKRHKYIVAHLQTFMYWQCQTSEGSDTCCMRLPLPSLIPLGSALGWKLSVCAMLHWLSGDRAAYQAHLTAIFEQDNTVQEFLILDALVIEVHLSEQEVENV